MHTSTFRYASAVLASYNEARMTPLSQQGQTVLETKIDVQPHTGWHEYRDYWGTAVTAFEVLTPHESMVITAEHLVEVAERRPLRTPGRLGHAARRRAARPAGGVPLGHADDRAARGRGRAGAGAWRGPRAGATPRWRSSGALRDEMEYIPGVTTVHTPAPRRGPPGRACARTSRTWSAGALRSIGIPARYVSGYLHPDSEAPVGTTVLGDSHAWVEWWVGEWFAYDVTNRVVAGRPPRGARARAVLRRRRRRCGGSTPAPARRTAEVQVQITREA